MHDVTAAGHLANPSPVRTYGRAYLIEQYHRNIKCRTRPMLGFNSFRRAQTILAGIELVHMLRKGQLQHPAGEHLSLAEQFHLLAA
jgi:putative transposase